MAEPSELPYGHFGQPSYDPTAKTWTFDRSLESSYSLHAVGEVKLVDTRIVRDQSLNFEESHLQYDPTEQIPNYQGRVNTLMLHNPNLQSASGVLPTLNRISEAIETAAAVHDIARGDLLATGRITNRIDHNLAPAVAFASGVSNCNIELRLLQYSREGWHDTRTSYLQTSSLSGDRAIWHGPGAPIEQITFSTEQGRKSGFIAARLSTGVHVFRPILRKEPIDTYHPHSGLDINPILTIPNTSIGDCQLQDAIFNPFFNYQIGILNQQGSWCIIEMKYRSHLGEKIYTGSKTCTADPTTENKDTRRSTEDGWMRLSWVCDRATVAISSRRQVRVFDVSASAAICQQTVDFESFVTDMILLPRSADTLGVLTTSHLHIFKTQRDEDSVFVKTVLKIRHFRNSNDTTMRLFSFVAGQDIVIAIRSGLNSAVDLYRLGLADYRLILRSDPGCRQQSIASTYKNHGIQFLDAFIFSKSSSLYHGLFASQAMSLKVRVQKPTWSLVTPSSAITRRDDQFVISDSEDFDNLNSTLRPSTTRHGKRGSAKAERIVSLRNTAKLLFKPRYNQGPSEDQITNTVEGVLKQGLSSVNRPMQTISELVGTELTIDDVDKISSEISDLDLLDPETLPAPQLEDNPIEYPRVLTVKSIQLPLLPDLGPFRHNPSLSTVYNHMVSEYITSLSPQISSRVRIAKEKLIRCLATDIVLSTKVIAVQDPQETPSISRGNDSGPSSQVPESSQVSEFDMSTRPTSAPQRNTGSSRSTPLAIPRDRSSRATTPASSLVTSSTTFTSAPELANLSRYMTITIPQPATGRSTPITPTLPRALHNVLSHWTIGEDPAEYDWISSAQRVDRENELTKLDDPEITERDRERLRRRAERHLRRQRREAAATERAAVQSSQVLEIATNSNRSSARPTPAPSGITAFASSPLHRTMDLRPRVAIDTQMSDAVDPIPASSQSEFALATASQQVPGRFGGRPGFGTTLKKKKRKSGF